MARGSRGNPIPPVPRIPPMKTGLRMPVPKDAKLPKMPKPGGLTGNMTTLAGTTATHRKSRAASVKPVASVKAVRGKTGVTSTRRGRRR